jgi:hypothetical protein
MILWGGGGDDINISTLRIDGWTGQDGQVSIHLEANLEISLHVASLAH